MIRTIIFDLDGTLLDTISDLGASINAALGSRGFQRIDDSVFPSLVGYGARNLCERAYCLSLGVSYDGMQISRCCDDHFNEEISGLLCDFRENYNRNINVRTKPYEGIPDMLKELKNEGSFLNILSNKPDHFTKMLASYHFGDDVFNEVIGESSDFPRKPDPSSALHILKMNASAPGESILIGDGDSDIMTAKAAGMHSIAVLWGYRTYDELKRSGADRFASAPQDIIRLLKTDFKV